MVKSPVSDTIREQIIRLVGYRIEPVETGFLVHLPGAAPEDEPFPCPDMPAVLRDFTSEACQQLVEWESYAMSRPPQDLLDAAESLITAC